MSIISLNRVTLHVADNLILNEVDWHVQPHDKIALVGRNGMGKSSLLKLLQQELTPDSGQLQIINGLTVAGLNQEVPTDSDSKVYPLLVQHLHEAGVVLAKFHQLNLDSDLAGLSECQLKMDALQAWDIIPHIDMLASRLGINVNAKIGDLSGGMKRRVLLAAALIASPDVLLLDEPTNHLDIQTIEWLEAYLKSYSGVVILVTHDRKFLSAVASRIVEIDRGKLFNYEGNFDAYLNYQAARQQDEERHFALFDKRLSQEETWIRTGVKARRTRNEGRVRALKKMREQFKARRNKLGYVQGLPLQVTRSSELIFTVKELDFSYNQQKIVNNLSLLVTRGDKLGIVGPNGCGKTTLLRLLLNEITPDKGSVSIGQTLEVAYFDQLRAQLDDQKSVMSNVADGADYVTIDGHQKHVASYLREFLFTPERYQQAVYTLSGGERNRLLLAKLLAKPVNLLIMDEPTNDLDMETLELLEKKLIEYNGTLILISHDRAFIDNVVTSVLVYAHDGVFEEYVGGFTDYQQYKKSMTTPLKEKDKPVIRNKKPEKLTFNEQRELKNLPLDIDRMEKKINELQCLMAAPEFYQQDPLAISKISKELQSDEQILVSLYDRWQILELKNE